MSTPMTALRGLLGATSLPLDGGHPDAIRAALRRLSLVTRGPAGVKRPGNGADWPRYNSAPLIPPAVTILIQGIGVGGDTTGTIVNWGENTVEPNRYGILISEEAGNMRSSVHYGPNGGNAHIGPTIPGSRDGVTQWMIATRITGTSMRQTLLGGTLTTTSHTLAGAPSGGVGTHEIRAFTRFFVTQRFTGTLEIAALSTDVSDAELLAIDAAGSPYAAGVYERGDLLWALKGVEDQAADVEVLDPATQLETLGAWIVTPGGARLTIGGL